MLRLTNLQLLLKKAKWAFSTRRVDRSLSFGIEEDVTRAQSGDLVLGRVLSIGQHQRIQLTSGRASHLYVNDLVVLPCGARYAPDQFQGVAELQPGAVDMLAGGGCIGRMTHKNERMKTPTQIQPIGILCHDNGHPANTRDFALPKPAKAGNIPVIAVSGTAMNSGKTTATVALSHGLSVLGCKVAALKGTGTGAFGDFNDYCDTGAHYVADFTDAGMVTTYMQPLERIKEGIRTLLGHAEERGCDVAVIELADGLFQQETAALLADPEFSGILNGVIFACGDALAAAGGVAELKRLGLRPLVLTGMISMSPMAAAEAHAVTGLNIVTKHQLLDPAIANNLLTRATGSCAAVAAA